MRSVYDIGILHVQAEIGLNKRAGGNNTLLALKMGHGHIKVSNRLRVLSCIEILKLDGCFLCVNVLGTTNLW